MHYVTLMMNTWNMLLPDLIRRCHGSIIWVAKISSGSFPTRAEDMRFYKDARLRRLTRYRYNNVPIDTGGRYIYLRERDARDLHILRTGRRPGSR